MGTWALKAEEIESAECREVIADGEMCDLLTVLPYLFCPEYEGRQDVKQGLLCMLVSPTDYELPNGRMRRDRIHVLLYGLPGTGKTKFQEHLHNQWNSCMLTADPSMASLKGDSRRKDKGVQIFNQYHKGIICIDDIELMSDSDMMRDVMERGTYTITKGGKHEEYDSQCRIVAATNEIQSLSPAMLSRFDLIFDFTKPTIRETMEIAHTTLTETTTDYHPSHALLAKHIKYSNAYMPAPGSPDELLKVIENFLEKREKEKPEDG